MSGALLQRGLRVRIPERADRYQQAHLDDGALLNAGNRVGEQIANPAGLCELTR